MEERLNELVQNEVFMKRLLALDTDVEVQTLLAENDVELSLDEIKFIKTGRSTSERTGRTG